VVQKNRRFRITYQLNLQLPVKIPVQRRLRAEEGLLINTEDEGNKFLRNDGTTIRFQDSILALGLKSETKYGKK
jgi:hypothetical protein